MNYSRENPPQIPEGTSLIDTHCHLDMQAYGDVDAIVSSAADCSVTRIITVGIDVPSSLKAAEIAGRYNGVFATVGIHPHNAANAAPEHYDQLAFITEKKGGKIVGYGEIGLDYARNYAPRNIQINEFSRQLKIAKELRLPVIIHDRDAHDDTIMLLKQNGPFPEGGVMHCFSGDYKLARQVVDLGFLVSIPGIVTFKNSDILQQVVHEIPIECIIMETDGPFLAPVPYRGKTNKPEFLVYTAQKIAELKNMSLGEVARKTTSNAEKLFKLNTHNRLL